MTEPSAEDRLAIEELFAKYAWAVDTGNVDECSNLFVAHAVIEDTVANRLFEAPNAARDFASFMRGRGVFPGRQHWVGQLVISMNGNDSCSVRSFGMATHLYPTGANYFTWLGYYQDHLLRTERGWMFEERRFFNWERDNFAGYSDELEESR